MNFLSVEDIFKLLSDCIFLPLDLQKDTFYIFLSKIMQHNGIDKESVKIDNNLEFLVSTKDNLPIFLDFIFRETSIEGNVLIFPLPNKNGILKNGTEITYFFQYEWLKAFDHLPDFRSLDLYFFVLKTRRLYVYEHWGKTYYFDLNKKGITPKKLYYHYPNMIEPKEIFSKKRYKLRNKYHLKVSDLSLKIKKQLSEIGYKIETTTATSLKLSKQDIAIIEPFLKKYNIRYWIET